MNRIARACGELAEVGGSAGDHEVPPAPTTHRSVVMTDFPHDLVIRRNEATGTETWFRTPDWFIDSGMAFELPAAQIKVLLLMLRIRDRSTGRSVIDIPELCRRTGLKLRTVQDALRRLLEHRAGLLVAHGSAMFEPFPGTRLAGRKSPDSTVARETAPLHAQPTAQTRGDLRERAGICANDASASNSCSSNQKKEKAAAAAAVVDVTDSEEDQITAIAMLRREGFGSQNIQAHAQKGLALVSRIIDNADDLAARGQLKVRRSYIACGLRDGYAYRQQAEKRVNIELARKLETRVDEDLESALFARGIKDSRDLLYHELLHPHEVRGCDSDQLVMLIRRRLNCSRPPALRSPNFPCSHAHPSVAKAAERTAEGK